ncbi:MAG: HD domain-containing protein [Solirubrobacteraceae bacterium]
MQVRELCDGCQVSTALVVRDAELRQRRDGTEYLKLTLGDSSGRVPAVVLDAVAEAREHSQVGDVVYVVGTYSLHARLGPRVVVQTLRRAHESEYQLDDLIDGPALSPEQMEADLRGLVATVQNHHLRELLTRILGEDTETWARFRDAPAAKHYHQAYRHGLLEHCLSVAQAVSVTSATFPGVDRDVAVTGALLHDIGKLDAYSQRGDAIEMSKQGRLYGEIPLGYYCVRRHIEELGGFPDELAEAVLHIILSHHGSLEHGSPVVPCTREATLVHMIDNLGSRLGSFDRIEKALPAGAQWSAYDKAIGGGAYFGPLAVPERRAA